jgi:hypothetical protein
MFENLLGKTSKNKSIEKEESEIVSRISKMNLTDMRIYLKGNMAGIVPCEDGLNAIMDKLITIDEDTLKRYIEIDDMDVKMKKGFDVVLLVAQNRKITVEIVEKIQNFITLYEDVILKFDIHNKQIYASKLNDALLLAINNINMMSELNDKMSILKD